MIALIAANAYVFAFGVSWGPAVWTMLGEMFPNRLRGSAMAVAVMAQWLANWLVTMSFPPMLRGLGPAVAYGVYAALRAAGGGLRAAPRARDPRPRARGHVSRPVVVVLGGGPAGLMAAEVLAEGGAEVQLCDAMRSVGRKFLLAGKGGLNLTHSESLDTFVCALRRTPTRRSARCSATSARSSCATGPRAWASRPSSAVPGACSRAT